MRGGQVRISVDEAAGGLGQMFGQYLRANLADFPAKRLAARLLRVPARLEASDRGIAVTLAPGRVLRVEPVPEENSNGAVRLAEVRASPLPILEIAAPFEVLGRLASGRANVIAELCKGTLEVRGASAHPITTLGLVSLLKTPKRFYEEAGHPVARNPYRPAIGGTVAAVLTVIAVSRVRSRVKRRRIGPTGHTPAAHEPRRGERGPDSTT